MAKSFFTEFHFQRFHYNTRFKFPLFGDFDERDFYQYPLSEKFIKISLLKGRYI